MTIDFKHIIIRFESMDTWKIINKHSGCDIALIIFWKPWNKYVLAPYDEIIFDVSCLKDIILFIESLNH
jgi:hypothetical protein